MKPPSAPQADQAMPDLRPYVIRTYDRWIILLIVLVAGWLLFRPVFAVVAAYRGVTFEASLFPDTAEHYYRKAIAIDRSVPDGWIRLGELFYNFSYGQRSRYLEAADAFEAGSAACPANGRLPFDLGRTYMLALKEPKKAEAAFRESVRRDPSDEFAWDYLGWAALKAGDRATAVAAWRQVLKINPGHDAARRAIQ